MDVAQFRAALSRAARAAAPASVTGALTAVLIEAREGGAVTVTGTDLNGWLWAACPAVVEAPGAALVPARVAAALFGSLDRREAVLSAAGGLLEVRCGGRYSLVAADPDGFPRPPRAGGEPVSVPGSVLRRALEQVLVAVPRDESSKLGAVCWEPAGLLVGTDAVRLALAPCVPPPGGQRLVLPVSAAALGRLLPDGEVAMRASGTVVELSWDAGGAVLRTVGTGYPDWRRVAEVPPRVTARAELGDLAAAFERVKAAAGEEFPAATVRVCPAGMEVTLASSRGKAREEVPCSADGEISVRFDCSLVLDGLGALARSDVSEVVWAFSGEAGASLITAPQEGSYRYVLLPLRPQ